MPKSRSSSIKSIPNLSVNLIETAFLLLIQRSLRVYRRNINTKRPPVAMGENVNAASAIIMLVTGLGYHLCRLKYLRDVAKYRKPLPYTPYFNWSIDDDLVIKLERLLIKRSERRLLRQLIELTVCRDNLVHPKFHTITESMDSDFSWRKSTAGLPAGVKFRTKTIKHKMKRKDLTRRLKLPLVPTWIGYKDAVICILVIHRFLNLLDLRYGNPYGRLGGITAYQDQTTDLFTGWDWQRRHPRELQDWVSAFFQSLSEHDQAQVKKYLDDRIELYLIRKSQEKTRRATGGKQSLSEIFRQRDNPAAEFLYKPPPHWPNQSRKTVEQPRKYFEEASGRSS